MRTLEDWSSNSNLVLNAKKTKQMIICAQQMSAMNKLEDQLPQISANEKVLHKVTSPKFFGVYSRKPQMA